MATEEEVIPAGSPVSAATSHELRPEEAHLPVLPEQARRKARECAELPIAERTHPFTDALELVRAASQARERMHARLGELKTYASQHADYYRYELAVVQTDMQELQQQSVEHEQALGKLEDKLVTEAKLRRDLEDNLEAAADLSRRLQEQLPGAEKRAMTAEAWLSRLQEEIERAFIDVPQILGELSKADGDLGI